MGVMMGDLIGAALIGALIAMMVIVSILINNPPTTKQEAFDRGYMVECLGAVGYYWECDDG